MKAKIARKCVKPWHVGEEPHDLFNFDELLIGLVKYESNTVTV